MRMHWPLRRNQDGTAHPNPHAGAHPATMKPRWAINGYATVRSRYEGSVAQSFVIQLQALDFSNQIILLGAGLLISLLPFLILLSAFASERVDDDIALKLGLDRRASGIVSHLFTSSPAVLNVATPVCGSATTATSTVSRVLQRRRCWNHGRLTYWLQP